MRAHPRRVNKRGGDIGRHREHFSVWLEACQMRDHFPFLCSLDRPPRRMTVVVVVVVVPDRRRKIDEYLCWNNRCLRPFPFFLLLRRRYKFWRLVQRVYGPKMAKPVEGDWPKTVRPKDGSSERADVGAKRKAVRFDFRFDRSKLQKSSFDSWMCIIFAGRIFARNISPR